MSTYKLTSVVLFFRMRTFHRTHIISLLLLILPSWGHCSISVTRIYATATGTAGWCVDIKSHCSGRPHSLSKCGGISVFYMKTHTRNTPRCSVRFFSCEFHTLSASLHWRFPAEEILWNIISLSFPSP